MRMILIICLFFMFSSESNDIDIMREETIVRYGNTLHSFFQSEKSKYENDEKNKEYINNLENKINNLYLLDENNNSIKVSSEASKIRFKQIDIFDKKNRKILEKGIDVFKVFKNLDSDKFTVKIIEFKVRYNKGKFNFVNTGGTEEHYKYSCEKKKWIIVKE